MKVTCDKELDVAYVLFRRGMAVRTIKLRSNLLMDLDSKGQVLGIELLSLAETAPTLRLIKKPRRPKLSAPR